MYKDVRTKWKYVFLTLLIVCFKVSHGLTQFQHMIASNKLSGVSTFNKSLINQESISIEALKGNKAEFVPGFDLSAEEIEKFKLWPSGNIPYYIDVYSFSDKVLRDKIRSFLNTLNGKTSVNFFELHSPPKDEEYRWIFFLNRRGLLSCADHSTRNFTTIGVQTVVLGYECMSTGNELAEAVLTIVGVPAQHVSPDRDEYITVLEDNIMPGKQYLFEKLKNDEWLFHDIKYDFASAGHYHPHKYSSTGRATIEMKEKYVDNTVGETIGLSDSDILKIRLLYNFISKKKQSIADCYKLFEPGTDFNNFQPDEEAIKPRKKPLQYLGFDKVQIGENNSFK